MFLGLLFLLKWLCARIDNNRERQSLLPQGSGAVENAFVPAFSGAAVEVPPPYSVAVIEEDEEGISPLDPPGYTAYFFRIITILIFLEL